MVAFWTVRILTNALSKLNLLIDFILVFFHWLDIKIRQLKFHDNHLLPQNNYIF